MIKTSNLINTIDIKNAMFENRKIYIEQQLIKLFSRMPNHFL